MATKTKDLFETLKRAKRALDGDSNDEEHDALFELVEALEEKGYVEGALRCDNADYTLVQDSAWITANGISIHVALGHGGVVVQTFPKSEELNEPITRSFTPYCDAGAISEDMERL